MRRREVQMLCLSIALLVCATSSPAQQTKESPPPLGTASFEPPASKKQEPLTPENFVVRAAIANMSEIDAGQLALQKSADNGIRSFASELIRDHRDSQAKLKSIAAQAKIALPGTIDAKSREQQQHLTELVGIDFDRAFLERMQSGHAEAMRLYEEAARADLPPTFKSYANSAAQVVHEHRNEAQNLRTAAQR